MTDFAAISDSLELNPDGIWVSRGQEEVFYPEEGNENCLALEADSFWFSHRNRCIEAVLRRFAPPGTLFDVGGGNGYVALGIQRAGFPVALVEPGGQGIKNACRRGLSLVIQSTLAGAGFHDNTLPAVGLFDVLEHIEDEGEFLREVNRLLIPGGRLYLSVPAYQMLWSAADVYAGHWRRYTLTGLFAALSRAGFRVEYGSYLFILLPLPALLLRAIPSRLGLQKQEDWGRYQKEHSGRAGVSGWALEKILTWELNVIQQGKRLPIGASCLAVAIK